VPQLEPSQEGGEGCVNTQTGSVSVADSQSNIVPKDNGEGGSSVNTQTGPVSVADSQSNIVLKSNEEGGSSVYTQTGSVSVAGSQSNIVISECTCPNASEENMLSESMKLCKNDCDCEKSVLSVISEVSERVSVPTTKKIENIKSDGANKSCFADILKSSNGYKRQIKIKINSTERGKFEIAKGSPVSMKKLIKQSITETSTNGKAASKETITQSNFVIDRKISVGQLTPSKRKLMEGGGGRGDVKSLVCIFENEITKPTWRELNGSESPAKRQRCSSKGTQYFK
jgi:hypothetical protein